MTRVLIVDDDAAQLRETADLAAQAGFAPVTATSGSEALALLRDDPSISAVVLDLVMPDLDGMAVLATMRRDGLATPVIMQVTTSAWETVVTALRHGAIDFFVKPAAPERLLASLKNAIRLNELELALRSTRSRRAGAADLAGTIADSPSMQRVLTLAQKAAKTTMPVLIEGETGTGKQMLARAIHGMGERTGKPFVSLDCSAVPPAELDEAVFGRTGKFIEAQGGTLFLDEIGVLSRDLQEKLLHVLQHGRLPVTGERSNARVLAATSRRLLGLAQAGSFREDLFYRLNVFPIYMPPLRDRREDIAPLAAHLLAQIGAETGRRITGIAPDALGLLHSYDWPGNVRQFENTLYRAAGLAQSSELESADFPLLVAQLFGRSEAVRAAAAEAVLAEPRHIDAMPAPVETVPSATDRFLNAAGGIAALAEVEKALIAEALSHYAGHMSRAARALGIGRSTLYRKLKEYGLDDGLESDAA